MYFPVSCSSSPPPTALIATANSNTTAVLSTTEASPRVVTRVLTDTETIDQSQMTSEANTTSATTVTTIIPRNTTGTTGTRGTSEIITTSLQSSISSPTSTEQTWTGMTA